MQPLNTTHGTCPRCGTRTVRFAADEERFEVDTNIAHTPSRCERVRRPNPVVVEVTVEGNDALIGSWFAEAEREGTDGIYLDLPDHGDYLTKGTRVVIYNTTDKAVYVGDIVNWVAGPTYVVKGA